MDASEADLSVHSPQTASIDQHPQASQPQRSRTTLVCGECKRLKLKCDRHHPCGSCLKRNSVSKCVYSPAAVEKVDIHSVNNRLMHVEAFTSTYTNGRFQPAHAPVNHPSHLNYAYQSTGQNSGWSHHLHHHHAAIPNDKSMAVTFSKAFQSLIPICLGDLGIVQNLSSSTQADIKLETNLAMDNALERISGSSSGSLLRISKFQLRQNLRTHRAQAHTMLPPFAVYVSDAPLDQNTVPQVTSALLSRLPPFAACQRLLQSAGDVLCVRPLPFDPSDSSSYGWESMWTKFDQLLSNSGMEKRTGAQSTRGIHPNSPSQPLLSQFNLLDVSGRTGFRPSEGEVGYRSSLTFFAMMCATLAIGALSSSKRDCNLLPSTPAFLYALSQQALGIWDTHISSLPSKRSDDTEQTEYLLASLLGVLYLLESGSIAAASTDEVDDEAQEEDMESSQELQDNEAQMVTSLVGKMIVVARNMHLDKETTWTKRKKKKSNNLDRSRNELKRMLWWEIVFYDIFIADALGQQPQISLSAYSTNLPSCGQQTKSEGKIIGTEDDIHGGGQDRVRNATIAPLQLTTETDEGAYFGARYQLARVAQAVKGRNSLPDCCCGYTLDQAVALENQIQQWQDALPPSLKVSGDEETQTSSIPSTLSFESKLRRIRAYELTIVSNVLVVNVYMPFLLADGQDGHFKNPPAAAACIHAAQAIVHLASGLQLLLSCPSTFLCSSQLIPVMFEFIPLEKLVFEAVVICAHAALTGTTPSRAFSMRTMADDVSLGLTVHRKLVPPFFSSVMERDGDDKLHNRVINALDVLLLERNTRSKGNVDGQTSGGDPQDQSFNVSPAVHHILDLHEMPASQQPPTQHTFIMDSLSSPSSSLQSDYSGSQSASRPNTGRKGSTKEKGKKGKVPAVGLRSREGRQLQEGASKFDQRVQVQSSSSEASTMPTISPIATSGNSFIGTGHRSRSSSTSWIHPQLVDSSMRFGTPVSHSPEAGMPPRKRPALHDIRDRQHHPPTSFPSHVFDARESHQDPSYNQLIPPSRFDDQCSNAGTLNSAGYTIASMTPSSYSHTISDSTRTHVPLSNIAQPTTYFTSPHSYGSTFVDHPPSANGLDLRAPASGNSSPPVVDSHHPMMSVPSTPVYDSEQSTHQTIENYPPHAQELQQHMQNHLVSEPYHPHMISNQQPMYDLGNSTVAGMW